MPSSTKFCGDHESAVDALVECCNRPRASLEMPSLPHLIGRELTPYYGSSEPEEASGKSAGPQSHKRKGSPPHHAAARSKQTASPASNKKGSKKVHQAAPSSPSSSEDERPSAPAPNASSRRPAHNTTRAPACPPSTFFSCPAMFHSPKPDALPVPSSSLLMRACYHSAAHALVAVA